MPAKKHLHFYKKLSEKSYLCMDPDCNSIMWLKVIIGKKVLCAKCRKLFLVTQSALRTTYLKCDECRQFRPQVLHAKQPKQVITEKIPDAIDRLFK